MKPELCACYTFCSRTWCWVIPACWLCVWWSPQNLLGVGRECPHWLPLWLESRPQQSYRGGERRLREGLAGQCLKPWRQGPGVGGRLAEERVSILGTETSGVGGVAKDIWASSLAEMLAQYDGQREPGRESFLGTRVQGGGPAQSRGRENALGEKKFW